VEYGITVEPSTYHYTRINIGLCVIYMSPLSLGLCVFSVFDVL
jgi:hypothetical protein